MGRHVCGIAGRLRFDRSAGEPVERALLEAMAETIVHRGPDDEGFWLSDDGQVGFAHRRLSILDLSDTANQPMSNEDGSVWIVYNGEIYNHAEIREELERVGGHRWKTDHSDTEVILHAYEEWGVECLERFRGIFAFALWDATDRSLWLVRDRIGVKPLYYCLHNGLTFASEIKAILADPGIPRRIDSEALYHYFSFLTTPAPQTMFAGIKKLPPGTWLKVSANGQTKEARYWEPHAGPSSQNLDDDLMERIEESVRLRRVADVPVGVFLSGGIDSSLNAKLFADQKETVKTFTIGYSGDNPSYPNETKFAKMMADRIGADHHELLLSRDDLLDFLPRMVWLQDEPIADPVCMPVYYVSKLATDNGIKVCQVGEGADELFIGYPFWLKMRQMEIASRLPGAGLAMSLVKTGLRAGGRGDSWPVEWIRRGAAGQPVFWGGAEAFTESQKQTLIGPDLSRETSGLDSWDAIAPLWNRYSDRFSHHSPFRWMTYLDLQLRLPELLLMRVDKMSMGTSLEARVPFLDHRLVELLLTVDDETKVPSSEPKHLLKRLVRGLIPDYIIDRPKQGFGIPIVEWFVEGLGESARSQLADFSDQTGLVRMEGVDTLLARGKVAQVWYLLNLAMWWKRFF